MNLVEGIRIKYVRGIELPLIDGLKETIGSCVVNHAVDMVELYQLP